MKKYKVIPFFFLPILTSAPLWAQSAVISDITDAVGKLSRIILIVITGCGVWAGLKFAKGDQDAVPRIVMCVAGAVIVGVAGALVNFFKV
jgi:hypothetical protein